MPHAHLQPSSSPNSPRPLLPIFPPPEPVKKPDLPSPLRLPSFAAPYVLSTHTFPAAHLRTTEYVPIPFPLPPTSIKAERQQHAAKTLQTLRDLRGSLEPRGSCQVLWNCANRYVRTGLRDSQAHGITLFFAHANGFPKEIWEPTLHHLLTSSVASAIDEVWTWESVQHGDACLINNGNLGGVFDWTDNARDILNFVLYFLPSKATSSSLPEHLDRIPSKETEERRTNPFRHRTLVVVGHSYGGCTLTLAALTFPSLFSSVLLIDPVIIKPSGSFPAYDRPTDELVLGALARRETWSSREEALQLLRTSPFFGVWDPEVLRLYVECGTYPIEDPLTGEVVVALKMPGIQEAVVFAECHTRCEVYHRLPELDEQIELRWIMPGKPGAAEFGPPGAARERVWLRPKNASNVRIPNAGHLIPQEQPQLLAEDIQAFICRRYMPPRLKL